MSYHHQAASAEAKMSLRDVRAGRALVAAPLGLQA